MIVKYRDKISSMEKDIAEIEVQEKEERELRATENQMNKAKRILEESKDEMNSEQKRVWFQSHKERMAEKGRNFQNPSDYLFVLLAESLNSVDVF